MATNYGLTTGALKWGKIVSQKAEKSGKYTLVAMAHCIKGEEGVLAPLAGSRHPDYPFVEYEDHTVRHVGTRADLTVTFVGIPPAYVDGGDENASSITDANPGDFPNLPGPIYFQRSIEREEPIETHFRYEGIPEANKQIVAKYKRGELKYDEAINLIVADANTTELFDKLKSGRTHYLATGVEWVEQQVRPRFVDNLFNANTIQTPRGPAPATPAGMNWLYVPGDQTQSGGLVTIESKWRLGKWDVDTYQ